MSDATTHLLLPYILAAQAQKHVTHNEALRILDGLVQLSVLDRDLAAPPGSPAAARGVAMPGKARTHSRSKPVARLRWPQAGWWQYQGLFSSALLAIGTGRARASTSSKNQAASKGDSGSTLAKPSRTQPARPPCVGALASWRRQAL